MSGMVFCTELCDLRVWLYHVCFCFLLLFFPCSFLFFSPRALFRHVVEYTLRAIAGGSINAADRFPRVLDCIALYGGGTGNVDETFESHIQNVPSWMLLRWAGQLMAHLDKPHAPVIVPVLVAVRTTHDLLAV